MLRAAQVLEQLAQLAAAEPFHELLHGYAVLGQQATVLFGVDLFRQVLLGLISVLVLALSLRKSMNWDCLAASGPPAVIAVRLEVTSRSA